MTRWRVKMPIDEKYQAKLCVLNMDRMHDQIERLPFSYEKQMALKHLESSREWVTHIYKHKEAE